MHIFYENNTFAVSTTYEHRIIPKKLGFFWDPYQKTWTTKDPLRISKLLMYYPSATLDSSTSKILTTYLKNIQNSYKTDSNMAILAPQGLSYLPYQKAGIEFACQRQHVLIADEMGLGKTIQAIGVLNCIPTLASVLIIAPASMLLHWKLELEKWLCHQLTMEICSSKTKSFPNTPIVITNYEQIKKYQTNIKNGKKWDVLICDEAHYLKNTKAQRTQIILGSKKTEPIMASKKIFLTGTPLLNRPIELWPLIQALDPNGLGKSQKTFVAKYCNPQKTPFGLNISGASNLDDLQLQLRSSIMIRRKKTDVLKELPNKRRTIVFLEPTEKAQKNIKEEHVILSTLREEFSNLKKNNMSSEEKKEYIQKILMKDQQKILYLAQIAKLRHDSALQKIDTITEWVQSQCPEKLVIMTWHKDVTERLAAKIKNSVYIHGGTPLRHRTNAVSQFQNNPDVNVFIGTIKAAGVGLTLTAASHMIFAELDWSPGAILQAEDRIHRIGQKNSVSISYLVYTNSLDAIIASTVIKKMEILEKTLDTTQNFKKEETNSILWDVLTGILDINLLPNNFTNKNTLNNMQCQEYVQKYLQECPSQKIAV
jgi:SWI/SNF-related matrix-associated actin-dependent regulator 1 of chromatin subfamily A